MFFSLSLSLSLSCANAVLQGLWGEPHQMPDMQRGDSFTAEAILGMK
jgi:predicted outer membrane lipoprotein